jgi:hypothetical protein
MQSEYAQLIQHMICPEVKTLKTLFFNNCQDEIQTFL